MEFITVRSTFASSSCGRPVEDEDQRSPGSWRARRRSRCCLCAFGEVSLPLTGITAVNLSGNTGELVRVSTGGGDSPRP